MLWKLSPEQKTDAAEQANWTGRFVLHRHTDEAGPHLDLRLERDGYLGGFRIDADSITDDAWASEKAPHPLAWLEQNGDAIREDAGQYCEELLGESERRITLQGARDAIVLRAMRMATLPPRIVGDVCAALREHNLSASNVTRAIADGVTARRRTIERLCGLARELDGSAFDEGVMRRSLEPLSLEEIHVQLRAYEVRFDQKYPPLPVSRPERIEYEENASRRDEAMAILRT